MEQNENGGSGSEASPLTPEQKFAHDLNELHSPIESESPPAITDVELVEIAKLAAMAPNVDNLEILRKLFGKTTDVFLKQKNLTAQAIALALIFSERIQVLDEEEKTKTAQAQVGTMAGVAEENNQEASGALIQSIADLQTEVAKGNQYARRDLEIQERALKERVERSAAAFVNVEGLQFRLDKDEFALSSPDWFSELSERQQDTVLTRVKFLNLANVKFVNGMVDLDKTMELFMSEGFSREEMNLLWNEMPGFRIVMATMFEELFEIREERPIGTPASSPDKMKLLSFKRGVSQGVGRQPALLSSAQAYKNNLTSKLTAFFEEHPDQLKAAKQAGWAPSLEPKVFAKAAVSAAWNLLYIGGAIESADVGDPNIDIQGIINAARQRAAGQGREQENNEVRTALADSGLIGRNIRDGRASAEQIRSLMGPLQRSLSKAFKKPDQVGTEEGWGGSLGEYVADNIIDTEFAKQVFSGQRLIFPARMGASFFDLTKLGDGPSLAEELVGTGKRSLGHNLFDYVNPGDIDFLPEGRGGEIWILHLDTLDSAKKVFQMMAGKAEYRKVDDIPQIRQNLVGALIKLKGTVLRPIFKDPDIVVSAIAGTIGVESLARDLFLGLGNDEYDYAVDVFLRSRRLLGLLDDKKVRTGRREKRVKPRKYIMERLAAKNPVSLGSAFSFFTSKEGRRNQIRQRERTIRS